MKGIDGIRSGMRAAPFRGDVIGFWLIALLVLGAGLGLRDPWPADEPRFALVARQMVESGDWLFPHRGPELYSDKPPLFMWLQAAFYQVVHNWRVAFLLPSLLASLGTLWCVLDLGHRLHTRRAGLFAGYALLFAVQFTYQAKRAQIDPLVTFWITLSVYGLLRHALRGPDWRMWTLGWFAAGLGTITKGVGAIALLVLLPAVFASMRGWRGVSLPLRDARVWWGPLAFIAACALWLVPMLTAAFSNSDPAYRAYLDDILLRQTVGRYGGDWSHPQPAYYFLGVIAVAWLPTALALPWAVPAWWRRLRRRDARVLLPLAWCALVVLFFSIPSGKRDMYILPALPMLCVALGPLLAGLSRRAGPRRAMLVFGVAISAAALVAGLSMVFGEPRFELALRNDRGIAETGLLGGVMLSVGAWGAACIAWFRLRQAVRGALWILAGVWLLLSLAGYPLLNESSSARGLMTRVGQSIGPDAELGLVGWREQHLLMADRPAATFGFKAGTPQQWRAALRWQRERPQRWLLVRGDAVPTCVDRSRARHIGSSNRRDWWLVPRTSTQVCPNTPSP